MEKGDQAAAGARDIPRTCGRTIGNSISKGFKPFFKTILPREYEKE
jgi:hypothetical protein